MTLDVATALSEHPVPADAVGACLGDLLEAGGPGPAAVVVAVTEALAGALEDVVDATRRVLGPEALVAVTVGGVVGGAREVTDRAAVMMFAVWDHAGGVAPLRTVRLSTRPSPDGVLTDGLDGLRNAVGTLVLFADPFSIDAEGLLDDLATVAPELRVVGGMLSAARHAGGHRLMLDGATWTDGAVGVLLPPDVVGATLVSQASRPIGPTFTVTAVADAASTDGASVLTELAGRPARAQLDALLAGLEPELRVLAGPGLFVGRVHPDQVEQLTLLGGDAGTGGLAVAGSVEVGDAVRFEVRDPAVVEGELLEQSPRATGATGGFVVVSALRGVRFHGRVDADAEAAADALGPVPLAGVVLGAEFAPVAERNRRLSASVVVLPLL